MYAQSTQVLLSSLQSLQATADYSDLTIFCGEESHRVHKAIVCPRSSFFAGASRFGEESLRNEVTLADDDPELVRLMIDYLYQLDYKIGKSSPPSQSGGQAFGSAPTPVSPVAQTIGMFEDLSGPSTGPEGLDESQVLRMNKKHKKKFRLSFSWEDNTVVPPLPSNDRPASPEAKIGSRRLFVHAQMYSIGDKYGILDLKEVARDRFAEAALEDWDDQGFLQAIQVVYTSTIGTDMGLRKVVVETLKKHRELLEKSEVDTCVQEVPGLAFDLLKSVWSENELWAR